MRAIALAAALMLFATSAFAQVQPMLPQIPAAVQNTRGQMIDTVATKDLPTRDAVASNQQTCATSATQMPAQAYGNGFIITAQPTNTGVVYIGGASVTTSTGYPLQPGQSIAFNAANSNQAYLVCANATDMVAITGS
jgi:hypothetical protein